MNRATHHSLRCPRNTRHPRNIGPRNARHGRLRHAFTFLEVLFAVILVGIGFIMIAAIFPVAIQQGQQNLKETIGTQTTRDALSAITDAATSQTMADLSQQYTTEYNIANAGSPVQQSVLPSTYSGGSTLFTCGPFPAGIYTVTANAVTYNFPAFLNLLSGSQLSGIDRHYGWVGFYSRGTYSDASGGYVHLAPTSQVTVFACQNTSEGNLPYTVAPTVTPESSVTVTCSTTSALSTITLPAAVTSSPIVSGCYLVVGDVTSGGTPGPPNQNQSLIGRVFRVGNALSSSSPLSFNLVPGQDLGSIGTDATYFGTGKSPVCTLYVVGAPYVLANPADPTSGTYLGSPQDLTYATSTISTPY